MPRPLRSYHASGMELDVGHHLQRFTYEDLKLFTEDFGIKNYIGRTQFGKVYRGKIPQGWNGMEEQDVTVKIWADSVDYPIYSEKDRLVTLVNVSGNILRFQDEVAFLSHPLLCSHRNLVKMKGFCCEDEILGAVYDLKPLDTLRNLIAGDTLKWVDRIKVALGLAKLLQVLHNHRPQYLVLNISAAHIILDQDCNPVLFEFGMLSTEVRSDTLFFPLGAYGYTDPYCCMAGWTACTDVFAFGVVLLELLCKCTVDGWKDFKIDKRNFLHHCAEGFYESFKRMNGVPNGALVDKSLMGDATFDAHDEALLSMLAVECVQAYSRRPTMTEVVNRLQDLHVLRNCGKIFGVSSRGNIIWVL